MGSRKLTPLEPNHCDWEPPRSQFWRKQGMSVMEKMIRELAYELWEQAGRPGGRSDEFWFAARFELERREETGDTQPPVRLPAEPPRQESAADWRLAASPASRQGPRGSGTSLAPRNIRLATL